MSPAELGRSTDPAQVFFNNLTLEFGTERPLLSHDKILSARPGPGILSSTLSYLSSRRGSLQSMAKNGLFLLLLGTLARQGKSEL